MGRKRSEGEWVGETERKVSQREMWLAEEREAPAWRTIAGGSPRAVQTQAKWPLLLVWLQPTLPGASFPPTHPRDISVRDDSSNIDFNEADLEEIWL